MYLGLVHKYTHFAINRYILRIQWVTLGPPRNYTGSLLIILFPVFCKTVYQVFLALKYHFVTSFSSLFWTPFWIPFWLPFWLPLVLAPILEPPLNFFLFASFWFKVVEMGGLSTYVWIKIYSKNYYTYLNNSRICGITL